MTTRGISARIRETAERLAWTALGQARNFDPKQPDPILLRAVQLELTQVYGPHASLSPCRIKRVLTRGSYGKQRLGQKCPGSGPTARLAQPAKLARVIEALRTKPPGKLYTELAAELGMKAGALRKWRIEIERAGLIQAQEIEHGTDSDRRDRPVHRDPQDG